MQLLLDYAPAWPTPAAAGMLLFVNDVAQTLECTAPCPQAILRGSERLDQFRLAMNFNQEELDQWAAAERAKEEDNAAVEAYRWVWPVHGGAWGVLGPQGAAWAPMRAPPAHAPTCMQPDA